MSTHASDFPKMTSLSCTSCATRTLSKSLKTRPCRTLVTFLALIYFILAYLMNNTYALKQITLGVQIPMTGDWAGGPYFASGISVAVDRINNDPTLLANYNVTYVWRDSKCRPQDALSNVVDMYTVQKPKIDAIIGPACTEGCKMSAMLGRWIIHRGGGEYMITLLVLF